MDCIFCEIIKGNIPSKKLYEDDNIFSFYDINPQAPVHVLVIPKMHLACTDEITSDNSRIAAYIFEKIPELAKMAGITNGYHVITKLRRRRLPECQTSSFSYSRRNKNAGKNVLRKMASVIQRITGKESFGHEI